MLARLTVNPGHHDKPVHLLERPPVFLEAPGQPIDQFGICRLLAGGAEIVRIAGKATAKVIMPYAIHNRAPSQSVVRMDDPPGQRQAAALDGFGKVEWIICLPRKGLDCQSTQNAR